MEHSYRFYENRDCEFYPCHKGMAEMNCLFCYCPLYSRKDCLGNPKYMDLKGKKIKICTDCDFPHRKENYDKIVEILRT